MAPSFLGATDACNYYECTRQPCESTERRHTAWFQSDKRQRMLHVEYASTYWPKKTRQQGKEGKRVLGQGVWGSFVSLFFCREGVEVRGGGECARSGAGR